MSTETIHIDRAATLDATAPHADLEPAPVWMRIVGAVLALGGLVLGTAVFAWPGGGPEIALAVPAVVAVVVGALLMLARSGLIVDDAAITLHFRPLPARRIAREDVFDVRLVDADARTYGGLGLRIGRRRRALLLSPGLGIEIEETAGRVTFVRTRRPEAAFRALSGSPASALHDDRI
jgi:hypothetical protein